MPQSMQLRTSVGALSRGEYVGAVAFAVSLTIGELASVSAIAVVAAMAGVKLEPRRN